MISKENYASSLEPNPDVRDALPMKILQRLRGSFVIFVVPVFTCGALVSADVLHKDDNFFQVQKVVEIQANLGDTFERFESIGTWWNPSHTFEGDASKYRFNLEKQALIESIEGGFVRHMDIIYWKPETRVVLRGGLGPLLTEAVDGILIFDFKEKKDATIVAMKYTVSGRLDKGLLGEWANAVDYVLDEQLERLKIAMEEVSEQEPDAKE